jgi:hypothetical protein
MARVPWNAWLTARAVVQAHIPHGGSVQWLPVDALVWCPQSVADTNFSKDIIWPLRVEFELLP